MAKNYDIKTASAKIGGVAAAGAGNNTTIGAVVPTGMTRYVTYLRVTPLEPRGMAGSKVYLCSGTTAEAFSDAEATAAQKMVIRIASVDTATATPSNNREVVAPPAPNTEHPLFTVAAGKFLRAHLATAASMSSSVQVFVQYFDE
jgi:hypothetical protein